MPKTEFLVAWDPPKGDPPYTRSLSRPQPTWRIVEAKTVPEALAAANPQPGSTVHAVRMENVSTFTRDTTPGFTPA